MARNKELLDGCNDAMSFVSRVITTSIINWDAHKRVVFASTLGSYIQ